VVGLVVVLFVVRERTHTHTHSTHFCGTMLQTLPCETENDWWIYSPRFVPKSKQVFKELLEQIKDKVVTYQVATMYHEQTFPSHRQSCKFLTVSSATALHIPKGLSYEQLPTYDWSASSAVSGIRDVLQQRFGVTFDYCLVHLYRDGKDNIAYHFDREAMNTPIASVSLGATRKFRFRRRRNKGAAGWDYQYHLEGGDLVYMKVGCQQQYVHAVPVEQGVKLPRINLTFRQTTTQTDRQTFRQTFRQTDSQTFRQTAKY